MEQELLCRVASLAILEVVSINGAPAVVSGAQRNMRSKSDSPVFAYHFI